MNTDVYFCSVTTSDDVRTSMAQLCEARWAQVEGVAFYPIDEEFLRCSPLGFQRLRRVFADQTTSSGVYIVADDDVLLPPDFDLQECLRVFKASGFSTMSLMPSNCTIAEWTPDDYAPESTPDVMEHYAAGHIRFCRKGHMRTWPPMGDGPGYDTIHGEQIRSQGGRTGYFRNHKALHLGEGYSSIWPK